MPNVQPLEEFAAMYQELAPQIFAFLVTRTGHRPTAEDLASQTWMKAWRAWPKARHTFPKAWVFRIARNCLIDFYRRTPDIAWDELASVVDQPSPDRSQDLQEVRRMMERLSAEQREIIILRIWEGLTFDEISAMLDISSAAAKMRYQRGVLALGSFMSLLTLFFYARPYH